jgi:two-component system sensor kinase FixL
MPSAFKLLKTRDVLEKTTDCVFTLDREWRFGFLNQRAQNLIGSDGELGGRSVWDAFPDARDSCAWIEMHEAAASRAPTHFEFFLKSLSAWIEAHAYPMDSGMQVYFRDITERRRSEERERAANERLALAQGGAGAGTWDLDLRTEHLHFCARSLAMHGFPPNSGSLSSTDWHSQVHPEDVAQVDALLKYSIKSGTDYTAEYRTRRGDGFGWVLGLGSVVLDDEGIPIRFVGLNFDITERKRNAAELERVQAELLHVTRFSAMGAMASTLAHELNQPLTAASNYATGLRKLLDTAGVKMTGNIAQALDGISDSTHRAGRIIRQLRDYVAKGRVERKSENLAALVDEVCCLALAGSVRHNLEVQVAIDPGQYVAADRVQIQQVLVNLVRNAVEAMANSQRKELRISARPREDTLIEIQVSDTGTGIDPDIEANLFTAFVTSKDGGMGVGLSICRTIVDAHGGQIWAERNEAGGASFCFTLRTE